jgi:hypothetical protein
MNDELAFKQLCKIQRENPHHHVYQNTNDPDWNHTADAQCRGVLR